MAPRYASIEMVRHQFAAGSLLREPVPGDLRAPQAEGSSRPTRFINFFIFIVEFPLILGLGLTRQNDMLLFLT